MKKLIMCIAGCIALAPGLAVAATFTGEIMDEACADDGGHQAMFKKMGTNDPKQCTGNPGNEAQCCEMIFEGFVSQEKAAEIYRELYEESNRYPKQQEN
jgi:hypothetical protein